MLPLPTLPDEAQLRRSAIWRPSFTRLNSGRLDHRRADHRADRNAERQQHIAPLTGASQTSMSLFSAMNLVAGPVGLWPAIGT